MKRSPLLILAVTLFLDMLGFGLILPLLPIYIKHFPNGTPLVGGLLLACFSTMQFLFSPVWGHLSDRYGRRPFILMSLLGSATSYFFFGAATSLWMLFAARVASGILTAASLPTSQAYIADVTPPEKRAGGMAVLGASFGLGFAFGPMVGGYFSLHPMFGITPLAMPAYVAAGMALLNFLWALVMLPESHTDRSANAEQKSALGMGSAILEALRSPTVGAQITVFAVATFAFTAVESAFSWLVILRFRSVIVERAASQWHAFGHRTVAALPAEVRAALPGGIQWSIYSTLPFHSISAVAQKEMTEKAAAGITSSIYMVVGLTVLLTQVAVMGGMARRVGEHRLVAFGSLLLTLTLVGLALAPNLAVIYALSACIAIGQGVLSPCISALITHSAGPLERGAISGVQQGIGSMSRIIAPPINNFLVGRNTAFPFLCSSVLMSAAFVLSLRLPAIPAGSQELRGRRAAWS
ncbi:MAG TPA: MFS transporter, partial [Chthonomonadales bacterium]|nr:MFS transporter [Chthonomonadales bacterium]